MRYSAEHQEETKRKILGAAGRGFKKAGFGALGVDALASSAGVTSGAFYGHFRSKAEAFRSALSLGLRELRQGIEALQAQNERGWVEALAEFYFTERVHCDLADGCALPSLSQDVARSDAKTKAVFETELLAILASLSAGLERRGVRKNDAAARAIVMAAIFAGGVTLARSVRDKELRERIANTLREATNEIAVGR